MARHDHDPAGAHRAAGTRKRLALALALAAAYLVAEVVGGVWTGSLALLADAGHMGSDVAALSLALFAAWVASHPADDRWTYGRSRAEILAALAQGVALVAVSLLIAAEAIERFRAPQPVAGAGVLVIATGGLAVNLAALAILGDGHQHSLNLRAAWLHVLSDALGSVGAMVAGLCVWQFGWLWADPAASLAIAALVLASAWQLVREAVDVLMEAAPRGLDVDGVRRDLGALAGVRSVHDLHVWTLGHGRVALSCHLVVARVEHSELLLTDAYTLLGSRHRIDHATIQVEPESLADASPRSVCALGCDPREVA
ncbi:MAG TPA: cation diffusion facilitator family transporter [Myxococcota bacterium]|nr:cation diffusion facilitator family transporter [Myxococcota bacterium]